MTIDLLVGETLDRKLADVRVPRADVDDVRRTGRRRRRNRNVGAAAVTFLAAAGLTFGVLAATAPEPASDTSLDAVPAMDFTGGSRALFDPSTGETRLGGQTFDLGADVRDLGTSAVSSDFGLLFFGDDQSVRLLPPDGRVRTLAAAPARADAAFVPSVRYDYSRGSVAWLTRAAGDVTLTVYNLLGSPRQVGSFGVPCGSTCDGLEVVGHDQGQVFVHGSDGTRVINPADGTAAKWVSVTKGEVVDVRNKVILSIEEGAAAPTFAPPLDATWRMVTTEDPADRLTPDGSWRAEESTMLQSTQTAGFTLKLAVPEGPGAVRLNLDSDGSMLVSRSAAGQTVVWDCDYAGSCVEFAQLPDLIGRSPFLGTTS